VTVFDLETASALSRAAVALNRPARVHIKVDTGMHRLGITPQEAPELIASLHGLPGIEVQGLFTHLASADDQSKEADDATDAQLAAFASLLARLDEVGLRPPVVHAANTALLQRRPDARYDLVRPGIGLYGIAPSASLRDARLAAALTWKTQVAQIHDVTEDDTVGYGRAWRAPRPSRIATIPVGYADGFRRAPQTWRHVLVRAREAPVVGRVSMDMATIDVTDIPDARQGDEVVLIGNQGELSLDADMVASWLGTISYEVVAAILARVPRVS